MEIGPQQLVRMARRWWWLPLLLAVASAGCAFWVSSQQQPVYAASARLFINSGQSGSDSLDFNAIRGSQSLAATYEELLTTRNVLQPVIDQLGLPYRVEELQGNVSARAGRETQLITVWVSDTQPNRAAAVANAIAEQFNVFIAQQAAQLSSEPHEAISAQISDTQSRVTEVERQIADLSAAAPTDPEARAQLPALRDSLARLQARSDDLLLTLNEIDLSNAAAQARVTIAERAAPPDAPYAPRVPFFTVLAALAGLLLGAGTMVALEFLDNTVKVDTDFSALIGAPLLAAIETLPKVRGNGTQLFLREQPVSSQAEAIRLLRTNIEFAAATKEIDSLCLTSPGPGEGKSTVTANLGVAMAQAGLATVIIDADLRRPNQHRIFGVRNDRGLTTLLTHREAPPWEDLKVMVDTHLALIPSGPLPPNPADLLSLDRFRLLVTEIARTADIVLIDTPPVLAVSDPLVVATGADGVILVCQAGRTRTEALRRAVGALHHGSARVVGAVLNQQSARDGQTYGYPGYDGPRGDEVASEPASVLIKPAVVNTGLPPSHPAR
ncbi:MAG: polysaccharide biosynthesis tyrosine autokinase [Chloroflexota bacterium]|nr:polysaccharide biosynthesis tyrosine autokinase [Chloroflexota bacterium]